MKKYIYLLLFVLTALVSMGQTQTGYVEVKGKVKHNGKALAGAEISIYQNNSKIKTVKTSSNGKFILSLNFDKDYVLEFSKKSFVSKKVEFDTHVNEKQYVWPYPFTIELFSMIDGLDISAMKDPVTKIAYSKDEGDFVFDIPYTNGMRTKMNIIQNQIKTLKKNAYSSKIAVADKKFREKEYKEAIALYEQAIDINPYTDYPDDQIMECERRLDNVENEQIDYDKAIASADAYLKQKKYEIAKKDYQKAKAIKPSEKYPKDKIAEIEGLLAVSKKKEQKLKYDNIIKKADALMAREDYSSAKGGYKAALNIVPTAEYPKGKIAEIDALVAENEHNAKVSAQYAEKIAEGDRLLAKREYQISKNAYLAASKIKPNEKYPQDKIKEIDGQMANMKTDQDYAKKIQEADALLAKKELKIAKDSYNAALQIKSTESYPKEKIRIIDAQLAQLASKKELDKNYSNFIKQGDSDLSNRNYIAAKSAYQKALDLKGKEKYPQDKIKEIDGLLAKQAADKSKEEQYANLIKHADASFSRKEYSQAKLAYQGALKIKPSEAYPKTKIGEIDSALATIAESKAKEKQYNDAIVAADKKLSSKDYQNAKIAYQGALKIKPSEAYPKTKIGEIDKILESMAADKAKEEKFNNFMKDAEAKFISKEYAAAKTAYQSALGVKPNEAYPQKKITEIDGLLAEIAQSKAKDAEYTAKIKAADAQLAKKDYTTAKTTYLAALSIKSKETYPKQKVEEIDGILSSLADAAEKEKLYKERIAAGDKSFGAKEYSQAKLAYQGALKIKPGEAYPKTKIGEIDSALALLNKQNADKKALEEKYKLKIEEGDRLLAKREYQISKNAFEEASTMKPDEVYPKQKIEEINGLLAGIAKETQYAAALKEGSDYVAQKKYSDAKLAYQAATEIMPNESFPKDKIKEIDALIAKNAKAKKLAEYKRLMADAETKFTAKDYATSRGLYQQASDVNPTAQYPKDKIVEIDKLLAQAANKDQAVRAKKQKYAALIQKGDANFSKEEYASAKINYKNALKVYPSEVYPKDKLRQIDKLMAKTDEIPEEINFENDAEKKKFMSSMASKYGEGVHEEKYESKSGKKVRRIIVVKEGLADEYREVKQPWGATYFFKNGKSVSRAILFNETKK